MTESLSRTRLGQGILAGIKRGWRSFVWMAKIVIPLSLAVALLQWSGWLGKLNFILEPVTHWLGLPPEAALPMITGMFTNLYAVIAIITVIPFSIAQMTLIAVFTMIAHGLIMEGLIQHKSGLKAFKAIPIRIIAAAVTVLVISRFLGDTGQNVSTVATMNSVPLVQTVKDWGLGTVRLLLKIFGIIMGIMIATECLRALGWDKYLLRFFRPVMNVLGLSRNAAMMWMTGAIFGLLYGGALIIEEAKKGGLSKSEMERLQISLGINHAMVEDPSLFAVLGLPAFWLWIPRLVTAILAVQAYRVVELIKTRLRVGSLKSQEKPV